MNGDSSDLFDGHDSAVTLPLFAFLIVHQKHQTHPGSDLMAIFAPISHFSLSEPQIILMKMITQMGRILFICHIRIICGSDNSGE
ncbi:MAG: hypothetical protein ACOCWY_01385 [Thermodesulfobacteriota bacterium]